MQVNTDLIKGVAVLARLKLTEKEVETFVIDFKEILEAFSKISECDTRDIKASFQPVDLKNQMREDKAEPSFKQEEALSNTEHKKDGYFKGPKAI